MTPPATGTPPKPQKHRRERTRRQETASQPDGSLPAALNQLHNAIHDLTNHRPHHIQDQGKTTWIPDRYTTLQDALYGSRGNSNHHHTPASMIPAWVDAMKLLIQIDTRTHGITQQLHTTTHHTPTRLQLFAQTKHRPQDTQQIQTAATEIASFSTAIDDLFSPKPIYLPDPCPACNFTHATRLADDGERIRTPALSLTVERGATCNNCHATWHPMFLGRLLGYHPLPGVIT